MYIDELLFDDEMEILEEDKKYPQSFAVPMQINISIKDIWIPAHLLPNRQKALDSDRIRPNLYHTLNKPKVESFLTYEDTEAKKNFVQLHSLNDKLSSDFQDNAFESEHNSSASVDFVNAGKESHTGHLHERNFNSETQLCDVEANYPNNADPKNSIDIIKKTRADDFISSCSLEASIEHPNDNQQHMLQNPETSRVQYEETALNPVDNKSKSSDLLCTADQEDHLDTITNETSQFCKTETDCDIKNHSASFLETLDLEKTSEDSTTSSSFEVLENLPLAYKKQVVEEQPTKQKRQKGKKKKNAVNKAIQLGEFLDIPNVDGYEIPKRDLFYEGLVAQGLCPPIDNPYYSEPAENCYEFPEQDSAPPSKKYASSLFEEFVPNEKVPVDEPIEYLVSNETSDDVTDEALTTLVLENLPDGTSKDSISTLMSDYGEIKRITLVKIGKSSKSYVELILQHDVEWIIDCLNDTNPFGASCEKLKCYQIKT